MKKKPASKSAFLNPRVLIGFAICAIGLVVALLVFGLYPGGTAFARANQSNAQEQVSGGQDQSSAGELAGDMAPSFRIRDAAISRSPESPDQSSCSLVVLAGGSGTSQNERAPNINFRFGRAVYLITPAEMASAGYASGNSPSQIGWNYSTASGAAGTAPLIVYLQNTSDTTNLKSTTWATAITGMTTVHNASTTLPATAGPFVVPFAGGSPFTYTGSGLYVAFDWGQYAGTLSTTTVVSCSTALTAGLLGGQSNTVAPTTIAASNFRPETSLGSTTANDAGVNAIYSYGELPFGLVPAQVIKGVISNNGTSTQTNLPVTLNVTGADTFTNMQTIPTIASCTGLATATFAGYTPGNFGTDTVTVSVPADGVAGNNSLSKPTNITFHNYSYKYPGSTAGGGVGFTGALGALVAKFTLSAANSITAVKLEFPAVTATTYKVAIYGDSLGTPTTTPLYTDASDRTVTGTGPVIITLPSPQAVGTVFYVGIHQTNTTNAGLSYDVESPIRPGQFFISGALPVTAWTDESPGNDFKLNIGIILQSGGPTPSSTPTATATPTSTATSTPTIPPTPTPTVTPPPTVCAFTEQYFDVNTLVPGGWSIINNSTVTGSQTWFQGNPATFPAQSGATNSYVAVNFASDGGPGTDTISNWLLTPPVTLQAGAVLKFWTRTVDQPVFPDRLQVRMSTSGTSQDVGVGPTGTGVFTTLLLDINPTYSPPPQATPTPTAFPTPTPGTGYPNVWTQFTITLTAGQVPSPVTGRLAFRYFVENGGPSGANSDYIGIDTVQYACNAVLQTPTPQPTPSPTPTPSPSPGCGVLLYDQFGTASTSGTSSQNFETANDAFDSMCADDFVVPAGSWTLQTVKVMGSYFNGSGPAASVHVTFYTNSGTNLPSATVVADYPALTMVDTAGSFTIPLTPNLVLAPGTYWVMVQANMDFAVGGQWAWTDRAVTTTNSGAAWQNPGGGFGVTACLTWGRRGATCAIDAGNPDQLFQLYGCGPMGSPVPTPTPTPTPTVTPGTCFWAFDAAYPIPVLDEAVASVGGTLYSFGGVSTATTANAYKFDGTTWTAIAPLPAPLEYPAAVSDGTNIYILGGASGGVAQTTLYRYNVGADNYTTLAPFTTATWNHAAVYLNGKIYKFTGTDTAATPTSHAELEIYDISGGGWTTGAPYPVALSFVSGFAQGGFVYGAGGTDVAPAGLESLKTYRYDTVGNTWNDAAIADLPAPRWAAASTFYSCCSTTGAIMAGGYSNGNIVTSAVIWDPVSNTWSNLNLLVGERTRWNGAILGCNFYAIGGRSDTATGFTGTNTNQKFTCPCPTPTPTPTPSPFFSISGTVTYCSGPTPNPVAGVTMTLTGGPGGTTTTAANGTYSFSGLPGGINYTVTASKAAKPPGTSGINAVDVLAVQKHFLQIPPLLVLCHLLAGDVTPPLMGNPNGVDVLAIQKFFLQLAGTASTGFYNSSPANHTYTPLNANQIGQDFEMRVLGDVIGGFVAPRPGGGGGSEAAASEESSRELSSTVAAIALPDVAVDQSKSNFITAVKTSAIDANSKLVGFQGDFTFDERVVTFASQPVSSAGLTGTNWNVLGNVLPGEGPIRTLRVAAFSNDFTPLKGDGTLFNLNMIRVGQGAQTTPLTWAAAPDQFMFIDADLNTQNAGNAAPGSVTTRPTQR